MGDDAANSDAQARTSTGERDPYSVLDAWWGERLDWRLAERLDLPLDQALDLYEHCSSFSLRPLRVPASAHHELHPVMNPWPLEAEETIFAAGQARQFIDLLSGSAGAGYAYIRYAGNFRFESSDSDLRPIGDYKLFTRTNTWGTLSRKLTEVSATALYAHKVYLHTDSVLPSPPAIQKESAQHAWLSDVRQRLRVFAFLRLLSDAKAVEIGRTAAERSAQLSTEDAKHLTLADDEVAEFFADLSLIREGNAPPENTLRNLMASSLILPRVTDGLIGTALSGGQWFTSDRPVERIVRQLLAREVERPVDSLMRRWISLSLPYPNGSFAEALWATQMLRADSELYSEWRTGVTEALQYASNLTEGGSNRELATVFAEKLGPHVAALRTEVSRAQSRREAAKESLITLGIGSVGVAGVAAVGGGVADAAIGAGVGAVGVAIQRFIAALRKPVSANPARDVFVALALDRPRS